MGLFACACGAVVASSASLNVHMGKAKCHGQPRAQVPAPPPPVRPHRAKKSQPVPVTPPPGPSAVLDTPSPVAAAAPFFHQVPATPPPPHPRHFSLTPSPQAISAASQESACSVPFSLLVASSVLGGGAEVTCSSSPASPPPAPATPEPISPVQTLSQSPLPQVSELHDSLTGSGDEPALAATPLATPRRSPSVLPVPPAPRRSMFAPSGGVPHSSGRGSSKAIPSALLGARPSSSSSTRRSRIPTPSARPTPPGSAVRMDQHGLEGGAGHTTSLPKSSGRARVVAPPKHAHAPDAAVTRAFTGLHAQGPSNKYVSPAPPAHSVDPELDGLDLESLASHTASSVSTPFKTPRSAPTTPRVLPTPIPLNLATGSGASGRLRSNSVPQELRPVVLDAVVGDDDDDCAQVDSALGVDDDDESVIIEMGFGPDMSRPCLDRFLALAPLQTVKKPLPGPLAAAFKERCGHFAQQYLLNPTEENLLLILALPKLGLAPKVTQMKAGAVHKQLRMFPNVEWPDLPPRPAYASASGDREPMVEPEPGEVDVADELGDVPRSDQSHNARMKAAIQAVEEGHLGRAAQILSDDSKVAPLTEVNLDILRKKHPQGERNPFGKRVGTAPGELPSAKEVAAAFATIPSDTAPGVSGWTPLLTRLAMRHAKFAEFITTLTCQVAQAAAPGKSMLCASRLTGLLKPDGGLRPIATGEVFYRGIMKTLATKYVHARSLAPFQFGVHSAGGVESVIHTVEEALDSAPGTGYSHLVQLDFKNAFNAIPRSLVAKGLLAHCPSLYRAARWAYNDPTPLVLCQGGEMVVLQSSEGVRQGDPIGPYCWSVGARGHLEYVQEKVPGMDFLAYLDDCSALTTRPGVLSEIDRALRGFPGKAAVQLNLDKSYERTLDDIRATGMRFLGTCVGAESARRDFLSEKIAAQRALLMQLVDLPHQHGLLVLRYSVQQNLRHLARTLDPSGLWDTWQQYDALLHSTVCKFRDSPRSLRTDSTLFSLPVRLGGLGVPSFEFVVPHARSSMKDLAVWAVNDRTGSAGCAGPRPTRQRERMEPIWLEAREELFKKLTPAQQLLATDSASRVGSKWLSTIPYFSTLRLTDTAVSSALHYRTLCPGSSEICLQCAEDNLPGHDELCTRRSNWRLARHEVVKKTLVAHLRSIPGVVVDVEPMVPGTGLRTDFRVTGPAAHVGVSVELDLTIVAPTSVDALRVPVSVSASPSTTMVQDAARKRLGAYLQKVQDDKRQKYGGRTVARFSPLAMTSGGTLGPSSRRIFEHWRSLSTAPHPFLLSHLSVLLVRARAEHFRF